MSLKLMAGRFYFFTFYFFCMQIEKQKSKKHRVCIGVFSLAQAFVNLCKVLEVVHRVSHGKGKKWFLY